MTDDNLLIEAERKIEKLRNAFDVILLCDADPKAYRRIAVAALCECDCVGCATGEHDQCYYSGGACWNRTHTPVAPLGSVGRLNVSYDGGCGDADCSLCRLDYEESMKAKNSACPKCGGLGDYHFPYCANVSKELDAISDAVLRYKPPAMRVKARKRGS